jgi:hypothetical protein
MFRSFSHNGICKAISVIELHVRGIEYELIFAKPNAVGKVRTGMTPESEKFENHFLEGIG